MRRKKLSKTKLNKRKSFRKIQSEINERFEFFLKRKFTAEQRKSDKYIVAVDALVDAFNLLPGASVKKSKRALCLVCGSFILLDWEIDFLTRHKITLDFSISRSLRMTVCIREWSRTSPLNRTVIKEKTLTRPVALMKKNFFHVMKVFHFADVYYIRPEGNILYDIFYGWGR